MGCGCQDIERDKEIIEYYNNKKAMEAQSLAEEYTISWTGLLNAYMLFIEDESRIVRIEKQADMWVATLR